MKKLACSVLLFLVCLPSVALADCPESVWAADLWGLSYHRDRQKHFNEKNWGLGVRDYVCGGNLFLAADYVSSNSVRGQTTAYGIGYEHPLFSVFGKTIGVEAEAAHISYEIPKRGTWKGNLIIPAFFVRWNKHLSINLIVIPKYKGNQGEAVAFATWRFN